MAFEQQPVDFNYFLARKYALQQQEANATSQNAASNTTQANAQALLAGTNAALNTTTNQLLPAESASKIGLQGAQARLFGEQANIVAPESAAHIASTNAATAGQRMTTRVLGRDGLGEASVFNPSVTIPGSTLGGVMGNRSLPGLGGQAPMYRLANDTPLSTAKTPTGQLAGETRDAWVTRLRAAGYGN